MRAPSYLCYPVHPFSQVHLTQFQLVQMICARRELQYSWFLQCCLPGATHVFVMFSGHYIAWMWQCRTSSNIMQTAKFLLCSGQFRMPIINLNLGYKLLAFCFLEHWHRIAFFNRAHKTPCSLRVLTCWRLEAFVYKKGRNHLSLWNSWSI